MNNKVEVIEENWLSVTQVNEMKNSIMQVPYFFNGPMVILMFYCHILFLVNE